MDIQKPRCIVVSNRLPFRRCQKTGQLIKNSGGLVSAISGIHDHDYEYTWVGISSQDITEKNWQQVPESAFKSYVPLYVDETEYDLYYNRFANDVLWPLFHYDGHLVQFTQEAWQAYQAINQKFADLILSIMQPNDIVWIHDFHLLMVPQYLKSKAQEISIGYFHHIPFCSSEIFRELPVRKELLVSLLSTNLIGFHDHSYLYHFSKSVKSLLGIESGINSIDYKKQTTALSVFPVSIDTPNYIKQADSASTKTIIEKYNKQKNYEKLILGVDRLDYTKGITFKLKAFRDFLQKNPDSIGKISLIQIAVPTRQEVKAYQELRNEVEQLISEINGKYSTPNYVPVQYIYSSVDAFELLALYRLADIMLITSTRDGMNLVSLEFLAAQDPSNPGVLMLSEFAGAISTLSHAISINPWDTSDTADKISLSFNMPLQDRIARHQVMMTYLNKYTASKWASSFLNALTKQNSQTHKKTKPLPIINYDNNQQITLPQEIIQACSRKPVIIFLDYDGTLVPICNTPSQAVITTEAKKLMLEMAKQTDIHPVIVSGRSKQFLSEQFKNIPIELCSEHGCSYKEPSYSNWSTLVHSDIKQWFSSVRDIMSDYSSRVPGSHIEEKDYAIAWHYRNSPRDFSSYQSMKLWNELESGFSNLPVQISTGKYIIEAKPIEANKGVFANWYINNYCKSKQQDYTILAIGDDDTDEDMFVSLKNKAITISVGEQKTAAQYQIHQQSSIVPFLHEIVRLKQLNS